jgi:hypothetical protein
MLIAALAVGLLTAYYFGLRPGMVAAGATAALLLAALVMPGLRFYAYGVLGAGIVGVCMIGPKLRRPGTPQHYGRFAVGGLRQAVGFVRRQMQSSKTPPRQRERRG